MSRSPRARQADVAERIRLFAEHHIVAVRTQRRTGEIVAVKHMTWGWISPEKYYLMQEGHKLLPLLEKTIEGGYRAKAALWGTALNVDVLGTGISLPLGVAFVAGALTLFFSDGSVAGNLDQAYADAAAPFLADIAVAEADIKRYQDLLAQDGNIPESRREQLRQGIREWQDLIANLRSQIAAIPPSDSARFRLYQVLDVLAPALPFGELYLIWRGVAGIVDTAKAPCDLLKTEYDLFQATGQGIAAAAILTAAKKAGCPWAA